MDVGVWKKYSDHRKGTWVRVLTRRNPLLLGQSNVELTSRKTHEILSSGSFLEIPNEGWKLERRLKNGEKGYVKCKVVAVYWVSRNTDSTTKWGHRDVDENGNRPWTEGRTRPDPRGLVGRYGTRPRLKTFRKGSEVWRGESPYEHARTERRLKSRSYVIIITDICVRKTRTEWMILCYLRMSVLLIIWVVIISELWYQLYRKLC